MEENKDPKHTIIDQANQKEKSKDCQHDHHKHQTHQDHQKHQNLTENHQNQAKKNRKVHLYKFMLVFEYIHLL